VITRRCFNALLSAVAGNSALVPVMAPFVAGGAAAQGARRPLLVFAAASLQGALERAAQAWSRGSGTAVSFSFGSSAALARQIEQGAPADLFASADLEWMDWVEGRGLIRPGSRRAMLANRLALIAGAGDPLSLPIGPGFGLGAALGTSRLAMGHPRSVPAGRYAQVALTRLGVWDELAPRIAGTDNVRAALALVARGEVRLGIVYETDARAEPRVRIVDRFPSDSHPPIIYPFAVTAASKHADAAALMAYISSAAARELFAADGFGFPD